MQLKWIEIELKFRGDNIFRILNINESETVTNALDSSKPIAFAVHGFLACAYPVNGTMHEFASVWSDVNDTNACIIDWSYWAHRNYLIDSVSSIYKVSRYMADIIEVLAKNYGFDERGFQLAGHSLGAHIIGNVGYLLPWKIRICYG